MYLVFHWIHSSMPLSEICHHNVIKHLLKKLITCLPIHHWLENKTDIAMLDFFINIDPGNFMQDKFEEHVHTQISKHNKIDEKKIRLLKCSDSSPLTIDEAGYHTSTKAYDIQCQHQDAQTWIKYIRTAYINAPTFVFHKL